jgi:hypothetical protein
MKTAECFGHAALSQMLEHIVCLRIKADILMYFCELGCTSWQMNECMCVFLTVSSLQSWLSLPELMHFLPCPHTGIIPAGLHIWPWKLDFDFFLGGVYWGWSPIGLALWPLIGLLCEPQVIMMIEKLVEWLVGETEVLRENLPQCRFVHRKPMLPGHEPRPPWWEASD